LPLITSKEEPRINLWLNGMINQVQQWHKRKRFKFLSLFDNRYICLDWNLKCVIGAISWNLVSKSNQLFSVCSKKLLIALQMLKIVVNCFLSLLFQS
jgi:hypothetical protein